MRDEREHQGEEEGRARDEGEYEGRRREGRGMREAVCGE